MCTSQHSCLAALPLCPRVGILSGDGVVYDSNNASDYKDDGTNILLDANENAYGPGLDLNGFAAALRKGGTGQKDSTEIDFLGLNRYPDPYVIPHWFSYSSLIR